MDEIRRKILLCIAFIGLNMINVAMITVAFMVSDKTPLVILLIFFLYVITLRFIVEYSEELGGLIKEELLEEKEHE